MRLVPASLQPYVSKAIEFFQIHEEDAALHTFLLYLNTLKNKDSLSKVNICVKNRHTFVGDQEFCQNA